MLYSSSASYSSHNDLGNFDGTYISAVLNYGALRCCESSNCDGAVILSTSLPYYSLVFSQLTPTRTGRKRRSPKTSLDLFLQLLLLNPNQNRSDPKTDPIRCWRSLI